MGEALAFHQAIGADRKAARLRYLTLRWANALRGNPRVKILSSLEPGQTYHYADLSGADGAFATLDYSGETPAVYFGREVTLDDPANVSMGPIRE